MPEIKDLSKVPQNLANAVERIAAKPAENLKPAAFKAEEGDQKTPNAPKQASDHNQKKEIEAPVQILNAAAERLKTDLFKKLEKPADQVKTDKKEDSGGNGVTHDQAVPKSKTSAPENILLKTSVLFDNTKGNSDLTALSLLKNGLKQLAAGNNLATDVQGKFVEKQLSNFQKTADQSGLGTLLDKKGDLTLLTSDNKFAKVNVKENQIQFRLGESVQKELSNLKQQSGEIGKTIEQTVESAESESPIRQAINSSPKAIKLPGSGETVVKQTIVEGDNAAKPQIVNIAKPQTAGSAANAISNAATVLKAQTNSAVGAFAQRSAIEAKFLAGNPRELAGIRTAISDKVQEVLQSLGIDVENLEQNPEMINGDGKPLDEQEFVSQLLGSETREGEDNALFAAALGVASSAAGESRALNGDGLLLEFANYGNAPTGSVSQELQAALASLLQSKAPGVVPGMLDAALKDVVGALEGVRQLQDSLGDDNTLNKVVGLFNLSVMRQEVVGQITQITGDSTVGLSEDTIAALKKAQNNLRDHLTPNDLVGALGDVKNSPVSVAGNNYNFLPEVKEAVNSLREARNRILNETSYMKADEAGVSTQQRFVREADLLLGIAQRVEGFLTAR